jgi:hypothetical protein
MDILSFSKITKPIYEGGTSIDLRPHGKWLIEVRRTDGTIRRPFGDNWIDNVFLNQWANGQLGGTNGLDQNAGWTNPNVSLWSFLDLFYGRIPIDTSNFPLSDIAVGSGTTPATQSDTGLQSLIRADSTFSPSGNTISWDSSSGNIIYSVKKQYPLEVSSVTYNEAGIRITSGTQGPTIINGLATNNSRIINRVVFPSSVILVAGEQLIITVAITIPTLASTAGKTITIAAQNGVNVSGVLKAIGTQASMAGGSVTAGGTLTRNTDHVILFGVSSQVPVALLSTKTAFDTLGVNPTWGTTNQVNGTWGPYTTNNRFRDVAFTWGNGTPAANTDFRSILFRKVTSGGALGGYQLLLNNQMTKASTATLALSLRFTI